MGTATLAVMFTDIKGFTARTSRQTRAENERLLALHDSLLMPVIQGYGGRRVKTIGDAYLVVFDSSTRAIHCGAAAQDRLAEYNQAAPEPDQIHVRIAINAGEVRVERGDVFGETVNIASRVEGVADAGEVCFTEAALLLSDARGFDIEDLGSHELKGIPEPIGLFRLRRHDDRARPYGGGALGVLRLAPAVPGSLKKWRPPVPGSVKASLLAAPALGGVVLLFAGGVVEPPGPTPMERITVLADSGQLDAARLAMAEYRAKGATVAEVSCLEGVLLEAEGKRARAIKRYQSCAEADRPLAESYAGPRLMKLLDDDSCEIRSASARLIEKMKYTAALPSLIRLSEREPKKTGFFEQLVGGCNAGDAARETIEKLGK